MRSFFHERGFVEVETPVRLAAPALELHIDAEPAGDHWLRTSPELHMKRLLARADWKAFSSSDPASGAASAGIGIIPNTRCSSGTAPALTTPIFWPTPRP
jgi:hypothetical protein